ncbi:L polymerase [ROUT virus]|uniref:RNA-directed RNA polymerase L n=1 Tax=ROUT virus TaxID=1303019 RepID=M4PUV6_9VIRU|nr:L polymerase [ROUT virus]AGH06042.1 L polymerase [ROUT virus]
MGTISPEDAELNRLKELMLRVLSYERDLYKPNILSESAGQLAVNSLKLRSTIHELNCCRDTGLKFNGEVLDMNEILDRAIGPHETVKIVVPDGYLIDRENNVISVLEASTRSDISDRNVKVELDRLKYEGMEQVTRGLGWTLNVIVISESRPRIGNIPESLMFKLLSTSLSILSYFVNTSGWISEEEYIELKKSMTSYDFKTLTEEFSGQNLLFDIESDSDPYYSLLQWFDTNKSSAPFSSKWDGPEITKRIEGFPRKGRQLRLLEILRNSFDGLNFESGHLSSLNKLKSLNLLNTRRQQNKVYDYLSLQLFVNSVTSTDFPNGWFPSVNDRLVKVESVVHGDVKCRHQLNKMIDSLTALQKESGSKTRAQDFIMLKEFLRDQLAVLKSPDELESSYGLIKRNSSVPDPSISLKIVDDYPTDGGDYTKYLSPSDCQIIEKVALNLILSQKTRSTPRSSHHEEFFYQSINGCLLLYKCSGEGQKAFSLLCRSNPKPKFFSFNINPSRLFPLIFSCDAIDGLIDQMMMLINPILEDNDRLQPSILKQKSVNEFLVAKPFAEDKIETLSQELRYLIYGILTTPTKRLQLELQSQRYYIMDCLSLIHHVDLADKVVGKCLTYDEWFLRSLAHTLINNILECSNIGLFLKVTWCLNISYLCHLITKETPDRLSDLRDCYEKFFKPKHQFMTNVIFNCKSVDELVERMELEVNDFITRDEPTYESKPHLYEPILADFLNWLSREKFNGLDGEQLLDPKDYLTSGIDVLDLTSNKSTFKRCKGMTEDLDPTYNTDKLLKRVICERLHKRVVTKRSEEASEIKDRQNGPSEKKSKSGWSPTGKPAKRTRMIYDEFSTIIQGLITELECTDTMDDFLVNIGKLLKEIELDLENLSRNVREEDPKLNNKFKKYDLVLESIESLLGSEIRDLIRSTCYRTKLSDFPSDLIKEDSCKSVVEDVMSKVPTDFSEADTVDVTNITAGMVRARYDSQEYFSSFKFLLLWAGFNDFQGTYDHRSGPQSSFLSISNKYRGESMLSTRVTNSEALQDRLLAIKYGAPTLRNILFSTLNLEMKDSEIGPNNKPLQFGLAIKEQVGGPRELYVGDSDTKLITRVLEETSRNIGNKLNNSCLNSDKKFSSFMKRIARSFFENEIVLSMDHSKWGPFNSPLQYHLMFEAMEGINDIDGKRLDFSFAKTILKWHLFKAVETPQILAEDVILSSLDISLGRRDRQIGKERTFETFMVDAVLSNKPVPSQVHSWFDMGQGILHHTSDLYGSLASEYITKKIKDIFGVRSSTMNTSDDMVLLFHMKYKDRDDDQKDKLLLITNFLCLVSNCLNKHISPKFCCSPLVGEFKSHFEVEATMVPLFTKFFAASINNFRCKTPMELFNTCDAIVEQGICNGMSLKLADSLKGRMVEMLGWLGYVGDPLMKPVVSRQQDWLEGCLSYRKLRSLESWLMDVGIEKVKLEVLKLELLKVIKELRESSIAPSVAYKKMVEISRSQLGEITLWFPTLNGEFKLIVRSKLNLGTTINETCENLLIKKLINHYSRYSKQGLGLLIAEGLERSAFQSSVVTGFIGLSISLSGPCVRKGDGTFLTLRESKTVIKPVAEVFPSLVMQSVCAVGDWVCGVEDELSKQANKSIYMRTSLVNTAEFRFGLDELTAAIEMTMPDLFDKYLKDIVPPDKRLLMRHSWKVRPEMELLIECANEGLSIFDGRIDRQEEAVVLVDYYDPSRLLRRVMRLEKRGSERTARKGLQAIINRMILDSILEPKIIDKVMVMDATKLAPYEGSMEELKTHGESGVRRYIQQVLLGRESHYRQKEDEPSEITSNNVVVYGRGTPETPLEDGTWIKGAKLGTSNPIKLQCCFQQVSSDIKIQATLITHTGRAHYQDFMFLKRVIISDSDFDEPEMLDTLDFREVIIVENSKPNGKPCFLFMGCVIPLESDLVGSIMTHMSETEWEELWKLVRTYFITRMKGEISCLPKARFDALWGMVSRIFGYSTVEKVVDMGFHQLDSFAEFLTFTNRVFTTKGPTLVFHRLKGILVSYPAGPLLYKGHRLMLYEDWVSGTPEPEALED